MTDTQEPRGDQLATHDDDGDDARPQVAGEDAGGLVARRIRRVIEHGRGDAG